MLMVLIHTVARVRLDLTEKTVQQTLMSVSVHLVAMVPPALSPRRMLPSTSIFFSASVYLGGKETLAWTILKSVNRIRAAVSN